MRQLTRIEEGEKDGGEKTFLNLEPEVELSSDTKIDEKLISQWLGDLWDVGRDPELPLRQIIAGFLLLFFIRFNFDTVPPIMKQFPIASPRRSVPKCPIQNVRSKMSDQKCPLFSEIIPLAVPKMVRKLWHELF